MSLVPSPAADGAIPPDLLKGLKQNRGRSTLFLPFELWKVRKWLSMYAWGSPDCSGSLRCSATHIRSLPLGGTASLSPLESPLAREGCALWIWTSSRFSHVVEKECVLFFFPHCLFWSPLRKVNGGVLLIFHFPREVETNLGYFISFKLSAMDVLVRATMKDAAKCETQCELQNSVNHQTSERKWRCGDIPCSMSVSVSLEFQLLSTPFWECFWNTRVAV